MVEIYLLMLRQGSEGDQVGTLQILLNAYGYRDADGVVGFNTWSAILK